MILIVASDAGLSTIWARHIRRHGFEVTTVRSQAEAVDIMTHESPRAIVMDLGLEEGSPIAIADFASYRCPEARVVFVSRDSFFSDGSLFKLMPNAAAHVGAMTPPDDLAAIVEHYAAA